jgi:uncharacterized protein
MEEKPSRNEDEYFVKHNAELIKQLRARQDAERSQAEAKQQPMVCPRCGATLDEVKMQSVLVDVCPQCKGMWLDAGELEIIRESRAGKSFFDSILGHRNK